MPQSLLFRILEAAAGLGIPRLIFFGGEPLLYPHLERAVTKAAELGFFTELDTNGQSLDRARLGRLAAAGLSSVMVSLHSTDPAAHERISGPGTFARAERAVKAAVACGLVTYVSACIFSGSLKGPGLKRLLAFARKHGALGARLLPYSPPTGLSRLPGQLARRLYRTSPDGYARSCVSRGSRLCDAQRGRLLYISRNGEARICPYASGSLGSLKDSTLSALLANKRRQPVKGGFPCQGGKHPA
jgi:MoaA/NifB/PqqE/SkfB family radical SAM enzyme